MPKNSKIGYFFITLIFFIFFDWYFSNLAIENLQNLPINPVFDLTFIKNTGAAFSILENYKVFLIVFSILAILFIIFSLLKNIEKASNFAIFWSSILISGIFCNMYERIVFGYVRDFIKLNFVNFPVFNISDIFINISVFAIVIIIIKNSYSKVNENNN